MTDSSRKRRSRQWSPIPLLVGGSCTRLLYTVGVFLGAFLLFQVQPMASKAILPNFGGSYLVWGGCMVFFQGVLLLGYAYAHIVPGRFGVLRVARLHPFILCLPVIALPAVARSLQLEGPDLPLVFRVGWVLAISIGLPFLAVSTVSVMLQRWYSIDPRIGGRNPYVLYSASNLGSLLGLLSYPLGFEILLTIKQQWALWWTGYVILVGIHFLCRPREAAGDSRAPVSSPPDVIPSRALFGWWALSAAGSATLLAVTNVITIDVASVPFLWVLPLCAYLLTFVFAFREPAWVPDSCRKLLVWSVVLGMALVILSQIRLTIPIVPMLLLQLLIVFLVCINCHGRLAQTKPDDPRQLTTFYLVLSLGGVCGSILVTWLIPLVSSWLIEFPLALAFACAGLAVSGAKANDDLRPALSVTSFAVWALGCVLALTLLPWLISRSVALPEGVILAVIAAPLVLFILRASSSHHQLALGIVVATIAMNWTHDLATGAQDLHRHRNYYGIYKVYEVDDRRFLQHGTTSHGSEMQSGPFAHQPVGYYQFSAPAPQLLLRNPAMFRDIAMIGLGTGALPFYASAGTAFTIYELDPDNLPIAQDYFTFLKTAADHGVELDYRFGDGRIRLRAAESHSYDLLVVDAFSSGAIPIHLITVEAVQEYMRVIRPNGMLLMHVSNRVLNLEPVIASIARELHLHVRFNVAPPDDDALRAETHWVMLGSSSRIIDLYSRAPGWIERYADGEALPRAWTDDYSNLFRALAGRE